MSLKSEFLDTLDTKNKTNFLFESSNQKYIEWLEGQVLSLRSSKIKSVCNTCVGYMDGDNPGNYCSPCHRQIKL